MIVRRPRPPVRLRARPRRVAQRRWLPPSRTVTTAAPPRIEVFEVADRLSLVVEHADGSTTRWAGDEADAALVAGATEFGDSAPGGFKDFRCELLRDLTPRADEGLFDNVTVVGAGGRVAWEGRIAQLPRSAQVLRPAALGWQAHLDDDSSFQEEYVNRDLTRWIGPSVQRRIDVNTGGRTTGEPGVIPDDVTGFPSLMLAFRGTWAATGRPHIEGIFDAGPVEIGSLYYAWKRGVQVNDADGNWSWLVGLGPDDRYPGGSENSGNLRASGPGSGTLNAGGDGRHYALAQHSYAAAGGADNVEYNIFWTCLAVYGRHGLTKQGAGSYTDPPGLLVTDMLVDVVRRGAPLLTIGDVPTDPFALTHFPNIGPARPSEWVGRLNAYLLRPWGVWEGRRFDAPIADPDTGKVWVARLSDGAQPDFDGDSAEDVTNGVVVVFTDPLGRERVVGPPGATADATSALLADTDPSNPVNAHDIPRRWALLRLSLVTTIPQAIQIGAVYRAEASLARRSGSITVTGSIELRGAPGRWPAWAPRAGDWITLGDRAGDPLRFITEKIYSHATRTTTLRFGSSPQKLDGILERMGAALMGVIGS